MPLLKRVQAGITRTRKAKGNPTRVCLPITPHLLRRIRQVLSRSDHSERVVLWAIACTAFFGYFRLGELPQAAKPNDSGQGLAWGQVAVDDQLAPKMVQVHLSKSKCDQVGLGADIVVGVTGTELCPVTAILQYIEARGTLPGPFFLDSSKKPVTKPWFVEQIRAILTSIGVAQDQYCGHSFRIGAATTAAMAGVEDSVL